MLLIVAGCVSVGLAFLGAILPLLPTSPFVLLAGICFARAWPRADAWLHAHPIFGPFRRMRGGAPTMTRRFKVTAILVVVLSFGATLVVTPFSTVVRVLFVLLGAGIVWFLARQPELPRDDTG